MVKRQRKHPVHRFIHDNALSLVMFSLFIIFLVGLSLTGLRHANEELAMHNELLITYWDYVRSGEFIEAVFENWESEFLQMGSLVLFTIWLKQKGSRDSKKLRGKEDVDTESRYAIIHATNWRTRKTAIAHRIYSNSLTIALFALFIISFLLHGIGGVQAANEEALQHGGETMSLVQYLSSSQFWFESFQNWQSEFLAVGSLLVLSIFLRQRKSPESKPIGEPNKQTGS